MSTILFIILSLTSSVETQVSNIFGTNSTSTNSSSSTNNLTDDGSGIKIGKGGSGGG